MSTPGKSTIVDDMELVRRVLAGDEAARKQLYSLIIPFVAGYAGRLRLDRDGAHELSQDFWVEFLSDCERLLRVWLADPRARLSTYLFPIAMRTAYHNFGPPRLVVEPLEKEPEPAGGGCGYGRNNVEMGVLDALDDRTRREYLVRLSSRLAQQPRAVFLACLRGEPKKQTCSRLPMESETYDRNLSRAREELKKLVEQKRKEESR